MIMHRLFTILAASCLKGYVCSVELSIYTTVITRNEKEEKENQKNVIMHRSNTYLSQLHSPNVLYSYTRHLGCFMTEKHKLYQLLQYNPFLQLTFFLFVQLPFRFSDPSSSFNHPLLCGVEDAAEDNAINRTDALQALNIGA